MNTKNIQLNIPAAIVVAGVLIAGAVVFGNGDGATRAADGGGEHDNQAMRNNLSGAAQSIRPVGADDHIFGDPDAPVALVEFSDFECPFCARIHPTLERIVQENPDTVKWVYRHFPLNSHRNAVPAAVASECVARLGGNGAFWQFTKTLFDDQRGLGDAFYAQAASALGIPAQEFSACLGSKEIADEVATDLKEAVSAGGGGTPYVVVITAQGNFFPFSGALPYAQIKQIVDEAARN